MRGLRLRVAAGTKWLGVGALLGQTLAVARPAFGLGWALAQAAEWWPAAEGLTPVAGWCHSRPDTPDIKAVDVERVGAFEVRAVELGGAVGGEGVFGRAARQAI